MQYSFATVLALAASSVSAYAYSNGTAPVYTTVVVDTLVTVCPGLATITVGSSTYTNTKTEASTITCSQGPYTVVTPVYTRSSVYCNNCPAPTYAPAPPAPVYPVNSTVPAPPAGTGAPAPSKPAPLPASGASKAFAMSGASLVGLMGLAAYLL